jgi:hypothetical protein
MGCGSSFPHLASTNKNKILDSTTPSDKSVGRSGKLPPINSQQKSIKGKEKRDKNLEPFTLICLDQHFDENDKQLRSIIDYICCFNDIDQCEQFIKEIHKNNLIFFIVSSEDFTNIISHIHELSQIIAIYVFQEKKSNNYKKDNIDKHWTKRYSKVRKQLVSEK